MSSKDSTSHFSLDGVYSCPVCHHGQIAAMPLMDTFACNFCRHIFTSDPLQQSLTMADSSSPVTWRWNGRAWRGANRNGVELGWGVGLGAIALVLLPTTIVALSAYIFPPADGSPFSWIPTFWIGLTFLCHSAFVASVIVEYYQFPVFAYWKAIQRHLLQN
ncbi:MAG: TIGR02652 family protein [Aphanothece sp. CMT-3BRIN-NPC111]|jgi:hypothetical protein|nr:TIGR02652 family protein [Aphanothece sp. CMT-3BRIN-NPC111]